MEMPISLIYQLGLIMALLNLGAKLTLGIALLRRVPWARKATIYTLIVLCILGVAVTVYNIIALRLVIFMALPESMHQLVLILAIAVTVLLAVVYTGFLIFMLCRPKVVQAYGE